MTSATQGRHIEVLAADGVTWVPLALAPNGLDDDGNVSPPTLEEALVGSDADAPLSEWLEVTVREDWSGGIGVDYDAGICLDTYSQPGYVLPSGAATSVTLPSAASGNSAGMSASPIVAIVEFGVVGGLFLAQRGTAGTAGRIMRSSDGTGVGAGAFANWNPPAALGAGEYLRDLLVARDPSTGEMCLWASSSSSTGASGRMHRTTDGTTWTSTAAGTFGTNGRNRLATVFWRDEDGIGDWRIIAVSSQQGHISYTVPGGDPMLAAGWVEGVYTGSSQPDTELVVGGEHVFISARDDLFDLDGLGNNPRLTSYSPLQQGNYPVAWYLDGWIYRAYGGGGIDRVNVEQQGVRQEQPGICTPGWGTKAESGWGGGYCTALGQYQGMLAAAMYSLGNGRASVYFGRDRRVAGVDTPNPLVWHGPVAINNESAIVTRMTVTNPGSFAAQTRLWLATWNTSQLANPKLDWVSLPTSNGALSDLRMGLTAHKFADGAGAGPWQPYCRLEDLSDTVGDKGSTKFPFQDTIGSLGLGDPSATTKLTAYVRADPAPGSTAWGSGQDITSGPTSTYTVSAITSGQKIQGRIDFFSPSGAASTPKPAVLDSRRLTLWRTAPDVDTKTVRVRYGPGVIDLYGAADDARDPQWTTDRLLELCRGNRTTLRDHRGRRWTVKAKHVLPRAIEVSDAPHGEIVEARFTFAILAAAS